jgi:hypothetical protein
MPRMADDRLLRDFANRHGLRFRWRTRRRVDEGGIRWYAEAEIWRDAERVDAIGTNCVADEQYVLDAVAQMLMDRFYEQPRKDTINLADQRLEGK